MSQLAPVVTAKPYKKSSGLWLPILFVALTGGLLLLIIFGMLGYQVWYLDRVYPGVTVADIDAGGMTQTELMAAVGSRAPAYLSRSVTIQAGDEVWTFTGQELGMRVDVATTAGQAYAIGREGNFLVDTLTQLRLLLIKPRAIEPVVVYDSGPTNQILQDMATKLELPLRDADLLIFPDARVEMISARSGRRMSVDATRPLVEAAIFDEGNQQVTAVVQEIVPGITDVEPAYNLAKDLLNGPLVFSFNSENDQVEWRVEARELAAMLRVIKVVNGEGKTEFKLELNEQAFTPHFEEFARTINREPVNARLAFDAEAREVKVLEESRDGRQLDIEALRNRVAGLVESPTHFIVLPVVSVPPVIPSQDVDKLGIKELVSQSTSYFKGSSQSRMHNIALAASKFNNVVVPPGQVFSFNKHLGPVTREEGFDESLIIQGNRTSVGLGGGVCQVSTTAFRVAFFGGYEIVERWAHGYRVSWYETNSEPGLDATVYSPNVDFKFRNDTDHYLLIQTETDREAGTLTFRFYSTNTGRKVTVSEPETSNPVKHGPAIYEKDPSLPNGTTKQVDWAVDGLDVTVRRTVSQGDTIIHQDAITSQYSPWQAVYKVGTGGE